MKTIVIAGAALLTCVGTTAYGGDAPGAAKLPPPDVSVKVEAPNGASEEEIAAAIAAENAKRDPVEKERAQAAKRQADAQEAHDGRVRKVCDSIPEKAMRDDPSLRKMCN